MSNRYRSGPSSPFTGPLLLAVLCTGAVVSPLQAQSKDSATLGQAYFKEFHAAPHDTISATAYQGWKQFELNCSR